MKMTKTTARKPDSSVNDFVVFASVGDRVLTRAHLAGTHAGTILHRDEHVIVLGDALKVWSWAVMGDAATVSGEAWVYGRATVCRLR